MIPPSGSEADLLAPTPEPSAPSSAAGERSVAAPLSTVPQQQQPHQDERESSANVASFTPLPQPSSSTVVAASSAEVERGDSSPPTPPADRRRRTQKRKNRCWECRRKIGLDGFECKCEYVFCAWHRSPFDHACSFDHRAEHRGRIERANPVVKRAKLEKI